ncbi:MAG: DNA polymerase I [Clostridiaceae bacterium]|nr:DNA polymerase I [Clostridiaceae bacterium]
MKLLALDANSLLNRAFYAIRPLSTKSGEYTNAIFGFLTNYFKLLTDCSPDAVCACFDVHAPTFRHMEFADYKAGRRPCPEELIPQFDLLKDILDAMGVPCAELPGFEADDLLGTISRVCEDTSDWECAIVTGDRDSFQLIGETTSVRLISTKEGRPITTVYTPELLREVYGVTPPQMIEVKALMGDPSDNIPGVAGIGEKTALALIKQFGTLDGVYENLDDPSIKKGVREKLIAGRESAYMSRGLAEIDRHAPLPFTLDSLKLRRPDNTRLLALFERLELRRFIAQLHLREIVAVKPAETERVFDEPAAPAVPQPDKTDTAILADADLSVVGILKDENFTVLRVSDADYREKLAALLDPTVPKLTHDAKPCYLAALKRGILCGGFIDDTAVAAYLGDPGADCTLAAAAEKTLGIAVPAPDWDALLTPYGAPQQEPVLLAQLRAMLSLRRALCDKIGEWGMEPLYRELEMPLTQVLANMQSRGFLVDRAALAAYSERLGARLREIEAEVKALTDREINLNSPKQLGELLFDTLALPGGKKTKTGWTTDIEVLESIKNAHPIIPLIIEYRQLSKLRGTYADGLPRFISPADGRIHSNFQQLVTATGRLSSTDPNLQNIPVRKSLGAELRRMFVARDGCALIDADYSQIELRLLAHIAHDEALLAAFARGEDIHRATAAAVAGIAPEEVTPAQRSAAKAVNFGIVYGISDYALAASLGISRAEARDYIARYFERYPGVHAYMENIRREAKEKGYVTTLFGRRRELPQLKSPNHNIRAFGERLALNTPIQGTAADIIKHAMLGVERRLTDEKLEAKLILQVHDELIVEAPKSETETVIKLLCEEMEHAASLDVRLVAEATAGETWYDAKG